MINPDWAKWIQRAVLKNFTTSLVGHTVLSETQNIDKNKLDHWYEVRVDIKYDHLNRDSYCCKVDINILVISVKTNNIYNAKKLSGLAASAFGDISVLDDNSVYKFCLRTSDEVRDTYYGEIESQANVEQATVEGTFEAYILE